MGISSLSTTVSLDRRRVLDTLVDNLDGMAYRSLDDERSTMLFVSRGCRGLTGYGPEDLLQQGAITRHKLTFPDDRNLVRDRLEEALISGQRFTIEYRLVTRDGKVKWVNERGVAVRDEAGHTVIEGFIQDVSRQIETIEAFREAELRYRNIFEYASEGIFQTTIEGRYLAANRSLARIYGYESPEALISDLADIKTQLYVQSDRRDEFLALMESNGNVTNFESEIYRHDGTKIWISENAHVMRDAQGKRLWYEGTVEDITERRSYQAQLEHQANHDQLTGLPNRNLLSDRLEQGISHARRFSYFLCLVFIDLDNFKFINDSLGHTAGDQLLVEISERLRNCLRPTDTVARQGGDEFVLVINNHYHLQSVISLLERVQQTIGLPMTIAGRELHINASIGIALYPNDGEDAATLLRHADTAMYASKAQGRNKFSFFTRELNQLADERLNIEAAMRSALENDEFQVHLQPKVDHRRRVVGVEALARWKSQSLGSVSPNRFIPVAEETGLIGPLTEIILRKAFAAAKDCIAASGYTFQLAVNLSPKLFLDNGIASRFADLLAEAGLPAERVEVEITESVFIGDGDRAITILNELKSIGVSIAMDDFGTGYSSLSYLRRFQFDTIKIDRSLVTGIENEDEVAMIARAVISLGQSLRKTVVAEGVESQAQFDFLRFQGCHEFQGFLMAKPIAPEELAESLRVNKGLLVW